jgi:transposase
MNPTTRYTVQERLKIVEAYFATKSVVLTQRQFRRDFPGRNPSSKLTIRRLLEKFRETGSVGVKNKGHSGRSRSARTTNNIETVIQRRGAWIEHVINY